MRGIFRTQVLLVLGLMLAFAGALFWSVHSDARQARLNSRLIAAVDCHDAAAVTWLLDQGADPNTREEGTPSKPWLNRIAAQLLHRKKTQTYLGRPLLTRAAGSGYNKIVFALLAKGAAVNAKTDTPPDDKMTLGQGAEDDWSLSALGGTALIDAAYNNQTTAALALINAGADVNAKDVDGETPLMNATHYDNPELVRALLAEGAEVNVRDNDSDTPLILATIVNNFAPDKLRATTVQTLLEAGADVNAVDNDGYTVLMDLADTGPPNEDRSQTAKVLLAHGARMSVKDKRGETALILAEQTRHIQVAALLRQAGAKQ